MNGIEQRMVSLSDLSEALLPVLALYFAGTQAAIHCEQVGGMIVGDVWLRLPRREPPHATQLQDS